MPVKESSRESFGLVVFHINQSIFLLQMNVVLLNPFTEGKVIDINMLSASNWLLCITHSGTSIIVLVCIFHGLLFYIEVQEDTLDQ